MPDSPASAFFLGRQPILDRSQRLVAYELLFRGGTQNAAQVTDGVTATATVIANAFTELGVADALGHCLGFINVDVDFLFSDMLELLPCQNVVLEILETVPPTPEVIERCRSLKAEGFTLALDDVIQVSPEYQALLDLVDIIKVDLQPLSPAELVTLTQRLKPLNKRLLAEKVDSREQKDECLRLGYDLFQGYYFAKPTVLAGKKLSHSQMALMKLMGLLLSDADTADLEAAFKPEPGLTVNLLRLTNSVGAGCTVRINSLRHAITVLGRRQLQRWLQLLLFASGTDQGMENPLLQMAATRGRLMELLADFVKKGDKALADESFMVGIMSLMPALVGIPMADIVAPLALPDPVRDALVESKGELGKLLELTAAAESGDPGTIAETLPSFAGLDLAALNQCTMQALAWAHSLGREKSE